MTTKKKKPLNPPDLERCQGESKNGPFVMGGTIGKWMRCESVPTVVITERKPGPDGQHGSMALCAVCLAIATKQLGAKAFAVEPLKPKMTLTEVRRRVAEIRKVSTDSEVAHGKEDALYEDVLRHIAKHAEPDIAALAEEALKVAAMKFRRWVS